MSGYFSRLLTRAQPGVAAIRPALGMLSPMPAPEPDTAAWQEAPSPSSFARAAAPDLHTGHAPAVDAGDFAFADAPAGRDEALVLSVELPLAQVEARASAGPLRSISAEPERSESGDVAPHRRDSLAEPRDAPVRLRASRALRAPFAAGAGGAHVPPPDPPLFAPDAEPAREAPWAPAPFADAPAPDAEHAPRAAGPLHRGPPRSPGFTAPRPGRAAAAAPSEVHVTIGRIEVHAVHGAPAQKRGAAERRPAQSLDTYLARRKRGGS